MQKFKNLIVWQKAHNNVLELYKVTNTFPREELYGLTSQMRRAAVSIPANIAEGCAKDSDKEFARYLRISLGSIHETEYYLLLSQDLGILSKVNADILVSNINEIKAMLLSLLKKIKEKTVIKQ